MVTEVEKNGSNKKVNNNALKYLERLNELLVAIVVVYLVLMLGITLLRVNPHIIVPHANYAFVLLVIFVVGSIFLLKKNLLTEQVYLIVTFVLISAVMYYTGSYRSDFWMLYLINFILMFYLFGLKGGVLIFAVIVLFFTFSYAFDNKLSLSGFLSNKNVFLELSSIFFKTGILFVISFVFNRMITLEMLDKINLNQRQEDLFKAVKESQESLGTVLKRIRQCVLVLDSEGKIKTANSGAENLFNCTSAELVGTKLSYLFSLQNPDVILYQLNSSLLSGDWQGEMLYNDKKGNIFPVLHQSTALRGKDDKVFEVVCFLFDLRREKALEEERNTLMLKLRQLEAAGVNVNGKINPREAEQNKELIESVAMLKKSNKKIMLDLKQKNELLISVSQEIRSPLMMIQGYAQLLLSDKGGQINEEKGKFASNITENCRELLVLVNNVINLFQTETHKVYFNPEALDINNFLKEAVKEVEALATRKQVAILCQGLQDGLLPDLSRYYTPDTEDKLFGGEDNQYKIFVDYEKLKQAFNSFLGVLVRLAKDNSTIEINAQPIFSANNKGADFIRFRIVSNKSKVPEEVINYVFYDFVPEVNKEIYFDDIWLNLSLMKKLVELHLGTIQVIFDENRSLTFIFTLPTALKSSALIGSPYHFLPVNDVPIEFMDEKALFYVVENDPHSIYKISTILREYNYKIVVINNTERLLEVINKHRPFAITFNVGMTETGWQILKTLKKNLETSVIPVVIITDISNERYAKELGAFAYLMKPFKKERLVTIIKQLEENFKYYD